MNNLLLELRAHNFRITFIYTKIKEEYHFKVENVNK